MRSHEEDVAEAVIEAILRTLWGFRVELTLIAIYGALGPLGKPGPWQRKRMDRPSRTRSCWCWRCRRSVRFVGRRLRHARLRRQWSRAVRSARILSLENRVPSVRKMKDIPAGQRFEVRIPRGSSVPDLEHAAEVIAAALRVREVRVQRVPDNASRARGRGRPTRPAGRRPTAPLAPRRLCRRQPLGTHPGRRRGGRAADHRSCSRSATSSSAVSQDPASRSPSPCWWRQRRSIPQASSGCSTASSWSWRHGVVAPKEPPESPSPKPSRCCGIFKRRWTTGTPTSSPIGSARSPRTTPCLSTWSSSTSWPTTSRCPIERSGRRSPISSVISSPAGEQQGSSCSPPRRSPRPTSSRPPSETCSDSAGRCDARRHKPRTRSSARAGHRPATPPPTSTRRRGASGTCSMRGASRNASAPTTSTTRRWRRSRLGPRRCGVACQGSREV